MTGAVAIRCPNCGVDQSALGEARRAATTRRYLLRQPQPCRWLKADLAPLEAIRGGAAGGAGSTRGVRPAGRLRPPPRVALPALRCRSTALTARREPPATSGGLDPTGCEARVLPRKWRIRARRPGAAGYYGPLGEPRRGTMARTALGCVWRAGSSPSRLVPIAVLLSYRTRRGGRRPATPHGTPRSPPRSAPRSRRERGTSPEAATGPLKTPLASRSGRRKTSLPLSATVPRVAPGWGRCLAFAPLAHPGGRTQKDAPPSSERMSRAAAATNARRARRATHRDTGAEASRPRSRGRRSAIRMQARVGRPDAAAVHLRAR